MNFRPLLIGACVCGLVAAILYRQASRPAQERGDAWVPPSTANPFSAPEGAVPLDPAGEGRSERTAAAGKAAEVAAPSAPPAPLAQPTSEQPLAAPARIPPVDSTPLGLVGTELGEDPYGFEAKYAGQDAAQIKLALDAVGSILAAQRDGRVVDKSQLLPPEDLAVLELEQQWLKQKAYP